ncbi:hypothetical protein BS78_09G135200 [Paspalum vaginatum]|nr:hypothetical protein BS78_09G135200 [Paspalum vaginatum]
MGFLRIGGWRGRAEAEAARAPRRPAAPPPPLPLGWGGEVSIRCGAGGAGRPLRQPASDGVPLGRECGRFVWLPCVQAADARGAACCVRQAARPGADDGQVAGSGWPEAAAARAPLLCSWAAACMTVTGDGEPPPQGSERAARRVSSNSESCQ